MSYDIILAGPRTAGELEGEEDDESYSLFRQEKLKNFKYFVKMTTPTF